MIHSFNLNNFYSFSRSQGMDLQVSNKTPESNLICKSALDGIRLNKVNVLIGPNASGKTNLLKGLVFISWFINKFFGGR